MRDLRRIGVLSIALTSTLLFEGCAGPTVDSPNLPDRAATVTVTQSETVTATESVTATETVTATVPAPSDANTDAVSSADTDPPPADANPPVRPTGVDAEQGFSSARAIMCAERVLRDVASVDERLLDGIGVSSSLYFLAGDYECLEDAGVPPGVDAADYVSRLRTLSEYAENAGDDYFDDPLGASATYSVVREETVPVLKVVNTATGSDFQLP